VNSGEFIGRLSMARSTRVTPLMFEYAIIQRAKSDHKHIVLPEGTEEADTPGRGDPHDARSG